MPSNLNRTRMAEEYGYALAFLKSDKELWSLFNKAVTHTWADAEFEAKLKATKWFQKHSASYREAAIQKTSDPATWNRRVLEQRMALSDAAAAMGSHVSESTVKKMASDALLYGWGEAELKNRMSAYVDTIASTGHFGGQAGEDEESLQKLAGDFGMTLGANALKSWVQKIARGDTTVQDYEATVRKQAESAFPGYADQIRSGMSARDIADPYMQSMSQILEMNPANIDLKDPTIRKALTYRNPETGKPDGYSLSQFEIELRKDPRWTKTKQAQDQGMNVARGILKDWGIEA